MRAAIAAAVVALAVAVAPTAGADPGTVTVSGDSVLCKAPAGAQPGDRLQCAVLPAALDALLPGEGMPGETWWLPSLDAPARESWVCTRAGAVSDYLTCIF